MGEFRAKDADRDRFVELIEAAYVDGQLNSADRDFRVERALSAQTLDDLHTLTRDLQMPAGSVVPPAASSMPSPAPPALQSLAGPGRSPVLTKLLGGFFVLSFVGVALFIGTVALTMFLAVGGGSTDSGTIFEVAPGEPEITVDGQTTGRSFELTASQVRTFLRAYEQELGTTEAYEVAFFPDRIQAQVRVRGSRPRMERWTWDGEWRQDTTAAAVTGPNQRVDVSAIDVRRMFANIGVAKRELSVERARFTHAILHRWADEPTELNIYVSNQFDETGYLSTTPSGEIARRHPYAS